MVKGKSGGVKGQRSGVYSWCRRLKRKATYVDRVLNKVRYWALSMFDLPLLSLPGFLFPYTSGGTGEFSDLVWTRLTGEVPGAVPGAEGHRRMK